MSTHRIARTCSVGLWLAAAVLVGRSVDAAIADPTPLRLGAAGVWAALLAGCTWQAATGLCRRRVLPLGPIHPATVPFDDVVAALAHDASHTERVRHLRVAHPGLARSSAARLVNEVAERPDL